VDEEGGEPRPVKAAKKKKVKTTIYQVCGVTYALQLLLVLLVMTRAWILVH